MYEENYIDLAYAVLEKTIDDYLEGWRENGEHHQLTDVQLIHTVQRSVVINIALECLGTTQKAFIDAMQKRKARL